MLLSKPDQSIGYIIRTFPVLILILISKCFCQENDILNKYFNNDSIKFNIYKSHGEFRNSRYHIDPDLHLEVEMPARLKDSLKALPLEFWLNKLLNPDCDWATNLILYDIFDRDASLIAYVYRNRVKWLEIRNGQIADWKEKLTPRK